MEAKSSRALCGLGYETPEDLTILRWILVEVDGRAGAVLQSELRYEGETFVHHLGSMKPVHTEVQYRLSARRLSRNVVNAVPEQQPMRLDHPGCSVYEP